MVQEAHGAQVLLDPDYRPKNVLHSNKNTGVCYILSFIMFSQKQTAAEPPHPILGPITPDFVSRKLRRDLVDLWEGTLQLYYNKLSLKMIDRGSRSTWDPSP